MKAQDFTTRIVVDATTQQVFDAINNVRGWWSENIDGDTDKLNSEFLYHYIDVHRCRMKIAELVPGKKVVWHVLDNYFKFTEDSREWTGTDVIFEIAEKGGKAQLTFTHRGLVPEYECYKICHDAWTHYIQGSLKSLILTGKGEPTPREAGEQADGSQQEEATAQQAPKSIRHRLLIESPVETVFKALTTQEGLAGWWAPEAVAKPEQGSTARLVFGPDYFKELEFTALTPYSRVQWLCRKGLEEWLGTTITFELHPHAKGTDLYFQHAGWEAYTDLFSSCSYDWALFLRSLKLLCETGKGRPYPRQND